MNSAQNKGQIIHHQRLLSSSAGESPYYLCLITVGDNLIWILRRFWLAGVGFGVWGLGGGKDCFGVVFIALLVSLMLQLATSRQYLDAITIYYPSSIGTLKLCGVVTRDGFNQPATLACPCISD